MTKGFRDFILRGNVIELAIAVVIGVAFNAVVQAMSEDFIGGIIGAIGGTSDLGNAGFMVNGSRIVYGSTLTALINFAIVAAVIYFLIVVPMNELNARRRSGEEAGAPRPDEVVLLEEIRDLLRDRGR